jgi:hypothetical protein
MVFFIEGGRHLINTADLVGRAQYRLTGFLTSSKEGARLKERAPLLMDGIGAEACVIIQKKGVGRCALKLVLLIGLSGVFCFGCTKRRDPTRRSRVYRVEEENRCCSSSDGRRPSRWARRRPAEFQHDATIGQGDLPNPDLFLELVNNDSRLRRTVEPIVLSV